MGAIGFVSPWLLAGLAALPIIWWLLRTTPPSPQQVAFPPTRILADLVNRERTPARSPWWLTAIRMLAAAALIFALAEPVLNPNRIGATSAARLAIVVDNGWASARHWDLRQATMARLIDGASGARQPVLMIGTATPPTATTLAFTDAGGARDAAAGLKAQAWVPSREAVAARLEKAFAAQNEGNGAIATQIVWLSDGLDYGAGTRFAETLIQLAGENGSVSMITPAPSRIAQALRQQPGDSRSMVAEILSVPADVPRRGSVAAISAKGQQIAVASYDLPAGSASTTTNFSLPLELRNQIARLEILDGGSAGAVHLLDARARWNRVGLIGGASRESSQPLLSPLYYLRRALNPFTDVVESSEQATSPAVKSLLKQNASTVILANIGTLGGEANAQLSDWVKRGGVLVRFAGTRLEQGNDELLPAPLRFGGRTLGGALSWSEPQRLAAFDDGSLFAGLEVSDEVTVRRQVLADPTRLGAATKVWARLSDGTPLVTARGLGEGWLVLFHITANSDWSNLPLSGIFVDMLRRVLTLGSGARAGTSQIAASVSAAQETEQPVPERGALLAPRRILDGGGLLGTPPPTAKPIALAALGETVPGPDHPPGYYGADESARALNAVRSDTELAALSAPAGVARAAYEGGVATSLKPWLFMAALALLLIDGLAVLLLGGLAGALRGQAKVSRGAGTSTAAILALAGVVSIGIINAAHAQTGGAAPTPGAADTTFALEATTKTRFAFVLTGDDTTDATSRSGLTGLKDVLSRRTAVEAGDPVGVDPARDELAFFPILYWPVLPDAQPLSDAVLARVDAYMKTGGMIIFDTRDQGSGLDGLIPPGNEMPLQRMLGALDVPRLEPVPDGHVLTKSFYLLSEFPGRWSGGGTWVEAGSVTAEPGASREAQQSDGVSSIIVTSHDLAGAWASDDTGRPLFAVVPGGALQREMSYRTGVNIVMYALTGNYKADQVHVPDLLKRLGQ
ncbi:MAG: DUF4159 domain-containing protein [Pseudomonadota bacterium]